MSDFLTALALIAVIEGLLYAALPETMRRTLLAILDQPPAMLRRFGLGAAVAGVLAIWLIRG